MTATAVPDNPAILRASIAADVITRHCSTGERHAPPIVGFSARRHYCVSGAITQICHIATAAPTATGYPV